MMGNRAIGLALAALSALSAGCYEEGTKEDCVGFKCPFGLQWPDGGEVRIWYIRQPDGNAIRRLIAYFHTNATGVPPADFPVGYCGPDMTYVQPPDRQYIDVGESITFQLGDIDIEVPRKTRADNGGMPISDPYTRQHEIAYLLDTDPGPVGDGFLLAKHSVITENEEMNRILKDIYIPPRLLVTSPQGNPVATFKKGEDVLFTWETQKPYDTSVPMGVAIVFVPDVGGAFACVAGNNDEFLVPAAIIDGFEADTGFVLVGTGTADNLLRSDGTMMGKWALTCQLVPWSRVE